jgi:hypothetical protein
MVIKFNVFSASSLASLNARLESAWNGGALEQYVLRDILVKGGQRLPGTYSFRQEALEAGFVPAKGVFFDPDVNGFYHPDETQARFVGVVGGTPV